MHAVTQKDDYPETVKIRRPARVSTDDRGRTVWVGEIEETELELMTSGELRLALAAADAVERDAIKALADSGKHGVVVRDCATGMYDVISESELQSLLERDGKATSVAERVGEESVHANDGDQLSLVSTQALQSMLHPEDSESDDADPDEDRGFNPYNRS